ncbi:MAG TPA: acyl transferase [Sphingobacteriaceae bacterium]
MKLIPASDIFSITNSTQFERLAMEIFKFQAANCVVYGEFIRHLGLEPGKLRSLSEVPFLPIEFFKTHEIVCGARSAEVTFTSSGTTGSVQSRHPVSDVSVYEDSFRSAFHHFYGNIKDYAILALLPSYLEREGSSLIYMVDALIRDSKYENSGYFLYNHEDLYNTLQKEKEAHRKTLLIGVTYALLDYVEHYQHEFPGLIVMETGGMKGKRPEMLREELHLLLKNGFGVGAIHSEYGMTELLSQAYSKGNGIFECPPWMKVVVRDTNDPFSFLAAGKTGGLNIIDLANINSCSFIATQDLGKLDPEGRFEVLGRFDNSDIRGCNLLVQ